MDFATLYGLPERDLIAARVLRRTPRGLLRIPIGSDSAGNPVALDIWTAPERGAHGIVVGGSGSGKSELLRTVVAGAAVSYPPEEIGFFLVDFRGDGIFDDVADLPHVSGMVSGVAQDLSLIERMMDTLNGEVSRRQQVYSAAGGFANVSQYRVAGEAGLNLEPLPTLVVVIDALDELLAQRPQFAELVLTLGRIGRSHGFSLLVSAQRMAENEFRGVEGLFTNRVALGDLPAEGVLDTHDACTVPGAPGHGYLRDDRLEPVRFTAAHPTRLRGSHDVRSNDPDDRTRLELLVSQMHSHDQPARTIWLPPLDDAPTLDQLIATIKTCDNRETTTLRVPIGIVDRPDLHRRDPLIVDLSGPRGNIGICGRHHSGKSTALQSLITALALTHTAEQVQFYCFDTSRELACLEPLPHVGSVARLDDEDLLRRTLNQLIALVQRRERYFRETGIESMDQFRRLRAADPGDESAASTAIRDDPFGDVFLVLDTLRPLRYIAEREFEWQTAILGVRGPACGVHVIATLDDWSEAHSSLCEAFGTRIELHMRDPPSSSFDSEIALRVPGDRPGRGLTSDSWHMLMALPRLDGNSDPESLDGATALAIAKIRTDRPGHPAPAIYQLPDRVDRREVLRRSGLWPSEVDPHEKCLRFPIGIGETDGAPVYLDLEASPHLIVLGEPGCGKTTFLRSIIAAICASNTVDQARIVLADYRATGAVDRIPREFLAGYGPDVETAEHLLSQLERYLDMRMPGPQESPPRAPEQRWCGPDVFVVIDDHELASTTNGNPADQLLAKLPFAREVGFHLILARGSTRGGRGIYESLFAQLRALGTTALIMGGALDEGELIGNVRPERLPPGRGILVTPGERMHSRTTEYIQTAWAPPA